MIKSLVFTLALSFHISTYFGQALINSANTQFGIGERLLQFDTRLAAMGGLSTAVYSSREEVNSANSAALSRLSLTNFSATGIYRGVNSSNATSSQFDGNFRLGGINVSFPIISKKWGISINMQPVSLVGYDYSKEYTYNNIGTVKHQFSGSGSISKATLGNGMSFILNSRNFLFVGVNLNYYFGSIQRKELIDYQDDAVFNTDHSLTNAYGKFSPDFSLIYQHTLYSDKETNQAKFLLFGVHFANKIDLNPSSSSLTLLKKGSITKDTTLSTQIANGSESYPLDFRFGVTYKERNRGLLGAEFRYETGASYFNQYQANNIQVSSPSRFTFILGSELLSQHKTLEGYSKKTKYRLGLRYSTPSILIDNIGYNEIAFSVGTYLPLHDRFSYINGLTFGMEHGVRLVNNATNDFFNKYFFSINFGFTINTKWFTKSKYN